MAFRRRSEGLQREGQRLLGGGVKPGRSEIKAGMRGIMAGRRMSVGW